MSLITIYIRTTTQTHFANRKCLRGRWIFPLDFCLPVRIFWKYFSYVCFRVKESNFNNGKILSLLHDFENRGQTQVARVSTWWCHICQNVSIIPSNRYHEAIFRTGFIKKVTGEKRHGVVSTPLVVRGLKLDMLVQCAYILNIESIQPIKFYYFGNLGDKGPPAPIGATFISRKHLSCICGTFIVCQFYQN